MSTKKIYFASDIHLGAPNYDDSLVREKLFVQWLTEKQQDAKAFYLMGDIFDFWFEYKHAIPKGFARLQGKIAEITDAGIPVHVFTGNHDMWMFGYLEKELGVKIHYDVIEEEFNGKSFFLGHGDGLGPGDHGYKFLKKVFSNPLCKWLFARLHPNFGIGLANYFSRKSRMHTGGDDSIFLGEENEWLVSYCKEILASKHYDYFVFGHRHLPLEINLNENSKYINLGDWIQYFTYAEFDGENLKLLKYQK